MAVSINDCSTTSYKPRPIRTDRSLTLGLSSPIFRSMTSRRVEILDAASRLISERGYSQTSVGRCDQGVGIMWQEIIFYHYYKSKESLGYAILDKELERLTERGLAISEDQIDPSERLRAFFFFFFIDTLVVSQPSVGAKVGACLGMLAVGAG